MAQVRTKSANPRKWLFGCSIGGVILGVVMVCIAALLVAWYVSRRFEPNKEIWSEIISPQNGENIALGQLVTIQSRAVSERGVYKLEVYADGALLAMQDSTLASGSNPLVLSQEWLPLTKGRHVLVARAYSKEGVFSDSSAVFMEVNESSPIEINVDEISPEKDAPKPSLAEISKISGIPIDEIVGSNPSLSGIEPSAPLPPGTHLSIPPPSPPTHPAPPLAPAPSTATLTPPSGLSIAAPSCTSAQLTWVDSPDETSYRVYRLASGETRPHVIQNLPRNQNRYTDTLTAPGTYYYQIASVRDGREALSLLANVTTAPACSPPHPGPPGTTDLMLSLQMLNTNETWDGVYCYITLLSRPHERIPVGDSTYLNHESFSPNAYVLNRLPNRARYLITAHLNTQAVIFSGECMGRRGVLSERIGSFNVSHPSRDWDSSQRTVNGSGFRLTYCLGTGAGSCSAPVVGLPPGTGVGTLDSPPIDVGFVFPDPTNLRLGRGLEACLELTDSRDQGLCVLAGVFTGGIPSLLWDWDGGSLVTEPSLSGYHVSLVRTGTRGGGTFTREWDVLRRTDGTLARLTLDRIDASLCGMRYSYTVTAIQGSRRSAPSLPLTFETQPCFEAVNVTVRFDSITMDDGLEDIGECCIFCAARDETLELNGRMQADTSTEHWIADVESADVEPAQTYAMSSLWGGTYQRTFRLTDARQTIRIQANFWDSDSTWCRTGLMHPARLCNVSYELPARRSTEWAQFFQQFVGGSSSSEGGCTISLRVIGQDRRWSP